MKGNHGDKEKVTERERRWQSRSPVQKCSDLWRTCGRLETPCNLKEFWTGDVEKYVPRGTSLVMVQAHNVPRGTLSCALRGAECRSRSEESGSGASHRTLEEVRERLWSKGGSAVQLEKPPPPRLQAYCRPP